MNMALGSTRFLTFLFKLLILIAMGALLPPAMAQDAPVGWIHLSESPDLFDPLAERVDQYMGEGPDLYAFLVIDNVPGGFITAFECRHWIRIADSSILVENFTPLGRWWHESSPPNAFSHWPTLPGEQTPAVLGYWSLRLLRGLESRGQIGLAPDSSAGIVEPLVLTRTGTAAPVPVLWGAGINTEPPEPFRYAPATAVADLSWAHCRDPKNSLRFPDHREGGLLRLDIHYPGMIRWGSLGVVVRDAEGVVTNFSFSLGPGHDPHEMRSGWVEDPREDGPRGPLGFLSFRHPEWGNAQGISVHIPVRVPGPVRPITIHVPWVNFETPDGARHFLWTTVPQAQVTVHGGSSGPGHVVHTWSPRRVLSGCPLRLVLMGDGLESVRGVGLRRGQDYYSALDVEILHEGRKAVADFPEGLDQSGIYAIQIEAEGGGSSDINRGILVSPDPGGLPPEGGYRTPWWYDGAEADYVIVTPDEFYNSSLELRDDIAELRDLRVMCMQLSEIREVFPTMHDSAAIREALAHAYWNWKIAPIYALLLGDAAEEGPAADIIPTAHGWHETDISCADNTFAKDFWFGDVDITSEEYREIIVGRLPVREPAQIDDYRVKLHRYDQQTPVPTIGFAVGDHLNNENRRDAAEALMQYIDSASSLDTEGVYAADFYFEQGMTDEAVEEAIAAVSDLFNGGLAVADFFGNTINCDWVTFMLNYNYYNPGSNPQFRVADQLTNYERLPVVFFSTCINGAFDENIGPTGEEFCPAEDFLMAENLAGAIAVVAKSHIVEFEADEEIDELLFEELLEGGASSLGFQVNGILERYLQSMSCSTWEKKYAAEMTNILGDPAMVLKLPGVVPKKLCSSFEAAGAVPLQNRLSTQGSWVSENLDEDCSFTRLVHSGEQAECCGGPTADQVFAMAGQRMLRICASHESDDDPANAAWVAFHPSPSVHVPSEKPILSYWVYQEEGISDIGRVIVDIITQSGRILSDDPSADFLNQFEEPFGTSSMTFPLGQWQHYYVRLGSWSAESVERVFVRYEEPSNIGGRVVAYLDEVFVGEWDKGTLDGEFNMVLNGEFSEDVDADGKPDFWTGPPDNLHAPPGAWVVGEDVGECVYLCPEIESPATMTQLLPSIYGGRECIAVQFRSKRAGGDYCLTLRIRALA